MPFASESLPDFAGQLIDGGRYQLLDILGSGAFGVVYRAVDNASLEDELVFYAVKCLLRSSKNSDAQMREFALQMSVCDHPNIVTIRHIICDESYIYVIMDYCPGGDLFGAITERYLYENNDELIRTAFVQLIDAVHACHEKSVFHRDLKPENVLCSEDGSKVYLSDFGLATKKKVCKDHRCGSVFYMSPECIGSEIKTGGYSSRHSDIWSLGIILANMITGRNPWRYAHTKDKSFNAYVRDRNYLCLVLPISRGASKILNRIFSLNPQRRITLPDLREEIMKLDTFFMSGQELEPAPQSVQAADEDYGVKSPSVDLAVPGAYVDNEVAPADPDEVYIFPSPNVEEVCKKYASCPCNKGRCCAQSLDITELFLGSPSNGATSEPESEGPITPETYAVDPVTVVPDLPEGKNIGESLYDESPPAASKKHRVRIPLFRKVVRRIKQK